MKMSLSLFGYSFIFSALLLSITSCKFINRIFGTEPGSTQSPPNYPGKEYIPIDSTQLIAWRNPDSSQASFMGWIQSVSQPGDSTPLFCQECDSNLVLLRGMGPKNYISGQTAAGGTGPRSGGGPSGGEGPVYYSMNFPITFTDTISYYEKENDSPIISEGNFDQESVTVAVFDTGLDSLRFLNYLYKSNTESCLGPLANNGWNFYSNTSRWIDDYPTRHGSVVSRFIVNEVNKYHHNKVKILPVKIHNYRGESYLFDVLCGLSYAANRQAKIINASFGFYAKRRSIESAEPDSAALLLKAYVKHYLTDNNILMIAAAGNRDDANETPVYHSPNWVDMRNLDSVCFYPASLARDLPNVIAVTTVSEDPLNKVSPLQNFSANVVDIGVTADKVTPDNLHYVFFRPDINMGETVEGSSFATPVATGKICANYYLIQSLLQPGVILNKNNLLNLLVTNNLLHVTTSPLTTSIRGGRIMKK